MDNTCDGPRLGGRLLLLDPDDRLLLIHAHDPHQPGHHWWELPGGGVQDGESTQAAAIREVTEETGYLPGPVGPLVWLRESRFCYKGRDHHRLDAIHLARIHRPHASRRPRAWTANEKTTVLGERWWALGELHGAESQRFLPQRLPALLTALLAGRQRGILEFYEDTRVVTLRAPAGSVYNHQGLRYRSWVEFLGPVSTAELPRAAGGTHPQDAGLRRCHSCC